MAIESQIRERNKAQGQHQMSNTRVGMVNIQKTVDYWNFFFSAFILIALYVRIYWDQFNILERQIIKNRCYMQKHNKNKR